MGRAALTRPLVKAAFQKANVSIAFQGDALQAADDFIRQCGIKTEFFVGLGAQRGQPAFVDGDDISPLLWNFTVAQLTNKLRAFREIGIDVHALHGKKSELVERVKGCMLAAAVAVAPPEPAEAASRDDVEEGSDWEDNTPDVDDEHLDEVIARAAEGLDDPAAAWPEDEDFDTVMDDSLNDAG